MPLKTVPRKLTFTKWCKALRQNEIQLDREYPQ